MIARQLGGYLLCIMLVISGCNGDVATDPDSEPGAGGDGPTETGGAAGFANLPPTTPLNELAPSQNMDLCDAAVMLFESIDTCRLEGLSAASSAGGAREERVAACEQASARCADSGAGTCKAYSDACTASVGEAAVCLRDLAEFFSALPDCTNFDQMERPAFPATCEAVQAICPEFF